MLASRKCQASHSSGPSVQPHAFSWNYAFGCVNSCNCLSTKQHGVSVQQYAAGVERVYAPGRRPQWLWICPRPAGWA